MKNPVPYMQPAMVLFSQAKIISEMIELGTKIAIEGKEDGRSVLALLGEKRDECFLLAAEMVLKEESRIS